MVKVREPQPGEILGQNYLLEQELGRGGFGVVFKARHIDIDRVVAIKVLLATYAAKDPRAKDRFKREAMIAASLDYPNSLRIFDYGETEAMQLLYGKSRYVTSEFELYDEQASFDAALIRLGLDLSGFGPNAQTLDGALRERLLRIYGFRIVSTSIEGGSVELEENAP